MESITIKVWATEQDEGGFMYDIFDTEDVDDETEAIDGGMCTSKSFITAFKMATSHAEAIILSKTK